MSSDSTSLTTIKIECKECGSIYMRSYEPSQCEYCGNSGLRINDEPFVGAGKIRAVVQEHRETVALLVERGKTHGRSYSELCTFVQALKNLLRTGPNWQKLTAAQQETLDMNALKTGRILCGDPNFLDHWDDIGGYTKLVADELREA